MEQLLEKGETVPTPMGKPRELPLGGFHGSVTNAARTALNTAPAKSEECARRCHYASASLHASAFDTHPRPGTFVRGTRRS